MINVELTAGGGGKGEARMVKLQERNKHLYSQRVRGILLLSGMTHWTSRRKRRRVRENRRLQA